LFRYDVKPYAAVASDSIAPHAHFGPAVKKPDVSLISSNLTLSGPAIPVDRRVVAG
jgi:hypothetical protein